MDGRPTISPSSPEGYHLSLVLPAWNEEAGIGQAIAEADEALRRPGRPSRISNPHVRDPGCR